MLKPCLVPLCLSVLLRVCCLSNIQLEYTHVDVVSESDAQMTYPRLSLIALLVSFATHADADILSRWVHHKVTSAALACCKMPTARMAKTGEFSANYVDDDQYRRWSMSVQPFDWLEATLRYTDVRTRLL